VGRQKTGKKGKLSDHWTVFQLPQRCTKFALSELGWIIGNICNHLRSGLCSLLLFQPAALRLLAL